MSAPDPAYLAFIDIDGVLNRICSNSQAKKRGLVTHHAWSAGNRWKLHLDPKDRQRLARLSEHFELAWGTTWEHDAHPAVGPFLSLPRPLKVVARTQMHEYSKAPGVLRASQGRPFVWFDDVDHEAEIKEAQAHKFFLVNPEQGLTDNHIDRALEWAKEQW